MTSMRITRHSASAQIELRADGVLLMSLHGPITADALLHFKAEIGGRYGAEIRAVVVDYTESVAAIDGPELDRVLAGSAAGCAFRGPVALLVPADCVTLFALFAMRAASQVAIRQVFSEPGPALRWAQSYAARQQKTT